MSASLSFAPSPIDPLKCSFFLQFRSADSGHGYGRKLVELFLHPKKGSN